MKNLSVVAMVLVPLILCSCKKSEHEEIITAANNAAEAARIGISNWALTNNINLQTNAQLSAASEAFPKAVRMAVTNEVTVETARAGQVVKQLHDQGRLPGISKDEHGVMTSDIIDAVVSNKATVITYPLWRTFHLVKEGDTSTNNYTLMKQTKDSEWKLQRAWETDSNGQIVKEWPVQ